MHSCATGIEARFAWSPSSLISPRYAYVSYSIVCLNTSGPVVAHTGRFYHKAVRKPQSPKSAFRKNHYI